MGLISWFSKREPEDYEQVLSSLAVDIQKRQQRLSDIRLRERRTTLLLTIYAFAFWVAYAGAWYAGLLPHVSGLQFEPTLKSLPVFVGPIIIQFSRRIVQTWYARIGSAEEKTLKALLVQQRNKVEEIKKKTNYYSTRNLIERYDATPADSPVRPRPGLPQGLPQGAIGTPQRSSRTPLPGAVGQKTPSARPANKGPGPTLNPSAPIPPPKKQWFDKLADALLGDDEISANGASSRYALICQKCFAHNGLVKEEQWEDAQYVCPKCGHFNASQRSIKEGKPTSPPTSPASISQLQHRRTGPRKSEPVSASPVAVAAAIDRRKSLPSPNLGENTDEERPPVPPLPEGLVHQNAGIGGTAMQQGDNEDHSHLEEMEIDS